MAERPRISRGVNPLYEKMKRQAPDQANPFVSSVWSDEGLVRVVPGDEIEGAMANARAQAGQNLRAARSIDDRKIVNRETQLANRQPVEQAGQTRQDGQNAEEAAEAAEQNVKAQAKAMVSGWTDEDLAAIEDAIADRLIANAPKPFSLDDEPEDETETAGSYFDQQARYAVEAEVDLEAMAREDFGPYAGSPEDDWGEDAGDDIGEDVGDPAQVAAGGVLEDVMGEE